MKSLRYSTPGIDRFNKSVKQNNSRVILPSISKSISKNISIYEQKSALSQAKYQKIQSNRNLVNVSLHQSNNVLKDGIREIYKMYVQNDAKNELKRKKIEKEMSKVKLDENDELNQVENEPEAFKLPTINKIHKSKDHHSSSTQQKRTLRNDQLSKSLNHKLNKLRKNYSNDNIVNSIDMKIEKCTSIQIIRSKRFRHPLLGKKARSIDQIQLDLDLVRNKLENTRRASYPNFLLMSVHDKYEQARLQISNVFKKQFLEDKFNHKTKIDIQIKNVNVETEIGSSDQNNINSQDSEFKSDKDAPKRYHDFNQLNLNMDREINQKSNINHNNDNSNFKSDNLLPRNDRTNVWKETNYNDTYSILSKSQTRNIEGNENNSAIQKEHLKNFADKFEYFKMFSKNKIDAIKMKEQYGIDNSIGRGGTCGFGTPKLSKNTDIIKRIRYKNSELNQHQNNNLNSSISIAKY